MRLYRLTHGEEIEEKRNARVLLRSATAKSSNLGRWAFPILAFTPLWLWVLCLFALMVCRENEATLDWRNSRERRIHGDVRCSTLFSFSLSLSLYLFGREGHTVVVERENEMESGKGEI